MTSNRVTSYLAPLAAVACFLTYSVIATTSSGVLAGAASPLLVVGIGLFVWQGRRDDKVEQAGA